MPCSVNRFRIYKSLLVNQNVEILNFAQRTAGVWRTQTQICNNKIDTLNTLTKHVVRFCIVTERND